VAGAGTKGRYDQRLPSVSFALGLNVCLIQNQIFKLSGKYCIFRRSFPDLSQTKLKAMFASICKQMHYGIQAKMQPHP
jgi:hypothetical protein